MPVTYDCLPTAHRPRWDEDGGLWYVRQGMPNEKPSTMYRHKPSINDICEPLLGSSIRDASGKVVGVKYPTLLSRLERYREGIEVVAVFKDYHDLFTLAMYRRQVTRRGGIHMDVLFFNLACEAGFAKNEWAMLAERMPDRSPIYEACVRRATLGPERLGDVQLVAAE